MKKIQVLAGLILCLWCGTAVYAEEKGEQNIDDFGFGDDTETKSVFSVEVGGSLSLGTSLYFSDFKTLKDVKLGSLIGAALHVHATAPLTEGYIGFKLNSTTLLPQLYKPQTVFPTKPYLPSWLDEAYLKILFDKVIIAGGLQKIHWGRADTLSVLDIVNPYDNTDLTLLSTPEKMKCASPLLSATVYLPHGLKLEGVFLPVFEGNRIVTGKTGRWYSHSLNTFIENSSQDFQPPVTDTLEYAQAGGRLTAAFGGSHDIGIQYFYGRLPDIAFKVENRHTGTSASTPFVIGLYNPYHHIGIDYALTLGPAALNAEAAASITQDVRGDNPSIYNPSLAWNIGAVYSMQRGLTMSVTAAEHIRIFHQKTNNTRYDVEYGKKATDTTLAFSLSQTLLRNSFEWKLSALVGLEDADFCIMPAFHWQLATLLIDCTVGIFGGKQSGMLGQFRKNAFFRLSTAYQF